MSISETEASRRLDEENRGRMRSALDDGDPDSIERGIDATRADMRATIEALERRFSFDRLVNLTVGRIRERGGEFAGNLTDAATRNPVPLLLTSIGLGWMMLTSRRGTRDYDSSNEPAGRGLGRRAREARERVSEAADRVYGAAASTGDSLRSAAEATREQLDHARSRMDRLLEEQPLMLGVLGIAAGAIVGALLPTSEHEDRLLGETREKAAKSVDKAIKDVAEKARERFEKARDNAAAYSAPNVSGGDATGSAEQPTSRPH